MAQQYSLKWNNHQPNFISMFAMLRNTQALVDVTLAAEGRHLHAHKMMLHSAKSLKVKGLTETESTSVMRSQSSDFPYETSGDASGEQTGEGSGEQTGEPGNEPSNEPCNEPSGECEPQRRTSASPANSPSAKRRR
ncbi:Protein tramtrack, beta isoform [Operophtera brumata]|uniref:Protein tramtrack, beta isoform n=1 Tax=Operophtera brumata TaxID=104452 RepID=A0A0L7LRD3_OPEBR|nr:Protein tramtrack, beta isoform [Operophtera brumata]